MEEGQTTGDTPQPVPSLLGLGKAWTRVGQGVLALAVLAFALNFTVHPVLPLPPGAHVPAGYHLVAGKDLAKAGGMAVLASPLGFGSVLVIVFSALAGFVWTFVDVFDRRKRFVWLLPAFICPLVGTLHALPLALYLFYGRETIGHSEGVQ